MIVKKKKIRNKNDGDFWPHTVEWLNVIELADEIPARYLQSIDCWLIDT